MSDQAQNRPQGVDAVLIRPLATFAITAVCAAVAWYSLLGWDHDLPYEAWQVIGLVVLLVAIGIGAGWYGHPVYGTLGTTVGLTTAVYADWSSHDDSGLYVIGVTMIFFATLAAGPVVTSIGIGIRSYREAGRSQGT